MLGKVSPAVVNISVQGTIQASQNPLFQDPLFRRFFGLPDNAPPSPAERFHTVGSGVVFDAAAGFVVTNSHVVDRADRILVTLKDRRQLEAKLVAADAQTDVAVLKVEAAGLTSLPLGDSDLLQVGDYVVAIGNPFGVGQTATFGIVSALGRSGLGIERYEDFIQTDASINPGNSGGALVDMNGHLIGLNAAILSQSGGNVGIGFAVPIRMVTSVARQLIEHGAVSRGALGVTVQDLTPAIAQAMGLDVPNGALVAQVVPQSAAAKAGIEEGDVVTAVDAQPVANSSQLRNRIAEKPPGTVVQLTVLRNGRERILSATLESLAAAPEPAARPPALAPLAGLMLGPIPGDDPNYGKLKGAYVIGVDDGSAAEEAGIRQGDIIVSADGIPVGSEAELARIIQGRQTGKPLLLRIRRGDSALFAALG
jgi:Do/DeqQ family serine protease